MKYLSRLTLLVVVFSIALAGCASPTPAPTQVPTAPTVVPTKAPPQPTAVPTVVPPV